MLKVSYFLKNRWDVLHIFGMASNENEDGGLCLFALALSTQYGYLNVMIIVDVIKQWNFMCYWLLLLRFFVLALLLEKVGTRRDWLWFISYLFIYLLTFLSQLVLWVPYIWICLPYSFFIFQSRIWCKFLSVNLSK